MKLLLPIAICIFFAGIVVTTGQADLQERLRKREADSFNGSSRKSVVRNREGRQSKGKRVTIEVEIDLKKLEGICDKYFGDDDGGDDGGWVFKYLKREARSREGRQSRGKTVTIEVEIDLKKLEGICDKYFGDDSNDNGGGSLCGWIVC